MPDKPKQKPKSKRRLVIGPAGVEKWADESDIGNLPAGFRPATSSEAAARSAQDVHGGMGGKVVAGLAGFGRSLTFGGTDWAATEAARAIAGKQGHAEMQAMLRDLQQVNPAASTGGEVAGLVGGIAGSMGKVAKAGALRGAAAMTPGAAVMRGGAALEGALMKAGAGRGLAMGARAGAEGAAFGIGHLLSESALGNTELTGEALFASMGEGALWGAGTAGALYGTGRLIGGAAKRGKSALQSALNRGSKEASEAATERMFGHGTPALDDIARIEAEFGGDIKAVATSWKPGAQAWRTKVLDEALPMRNRMARSLVETGTSIEDDFARFSDDWVQGGKHDNFGHLVSETPEAARYAAAEASALSGSIDDLARDLGDVSKYGNEFVSAASKKGKVRELGFLKNLRLLKRGLDDAVYSGGTVAEMRTATERIKRYLDINAKSFAKSTASKTSGFVRSASPRVETTANQWRAFLESERAWGKAGALQKPMNAALHDNYGYANNVRKSLQTESGNHPTRAYLDRTIFDSGKVDSFAKQLVNPAGDTTRESLVKMMSARAEAAEAVLTHGKLNAKQTAYLTRLRDNSRQLIKDVAETEGAVSRLAQLEELAAQEASEITIAGEFGGKIVDTLKGAAAVATGGGTVGAAETAGAAFAGGTMGRARKIHAIQTLSDRLRGKMDGPLGKLFGKAGKAAADAAGGVPITGARAAQYFAGEADRKRTAKNRREEYRERSEWVRARNEQQASDDVKETAAAVSDAAPNATVAAANTAARAQAYLASQLPRDGVPGSAMGPPPEASAMEVDSWLRKLKAVEDPSSILDDLTDGKLSRDSVEAVKAVYPALYEQMRGDVMGRINDMQAEGKQLPYRERIDLGTLLDIPTDPMLRPDVMATIQASYEQQNEPQATPEKKVPDLAGAYETESEQTEKDT